jgi:hypothetical protein
MPEALPRSAKRGAGRTAAGSTPLHVRADGVDLDARLAAYIRERAGRKLGKGAYHAERVTVRFVDVNGPRGGVDTECRIEIVLSGAPSLHVAKRAARPRAAYDAAIDAAERALVRAVRARGWSGGTRGQRRRAGGSPPAAATGPIYPPPPDGELVGRRVGRGDANIRLAAARPEKVRRDVPVDTAAPGRSATDRRAGGASTAARNTRLRAPRATAMLEDSAQDRPSRKSTRRSANGRQDNPLYLTKRRGVTRR